MDNQNMTYPELRDLFVERNKTQLAKPVSACMLSDMIDDLVRADCPQEKEAAYRQIEKLGVDRITADVIADERRKEAHL